MTKIGFKKMNWFPRQSAWNEHAQKLAKRRAMMREFEKQNLNLVNSFANVFEFQISSTSEHVARTAVDRVVKEGEKKAKEMQQKLMSGFDKTV